MSDANLIAGLREFAARNGIALPLSAEVTVRGGGGKAASLTLGAEELIEQRPAGAVPAQPPAAEEDDGSRLNESDARIVGAVRESAVPLTQDEVAEAAGYSSPASGWLKTKLGKLVEREILRALPGGGYTIFDAETES